MARATWRLVGDDFGFDERGFLLLDDTVATQMYTALTHHLGRWWADGVHGSRLAALVAGTPEPNLAAQLEDAAREALAPLERARRIRDLRVAVTLVGNRARIVASAHDIDQAAPVTLEMTT